MLKGGKKLTENATALFVISYAPGPNWQAGVPMRGQGLHDHFYYWKSLEERGTVFVAGAVGTDSGLVVLHAATQDEADQMIADDPASKAGLFVGEARPFVPHFVGKAPITAVKP